MPTIVHATTKLPKFRPGMLTFKCLLKQPLLIFNTVYCLLSVIAISCNAKEGARKIFPCFDEPEYKATFEVTMEYQDPYIAVVNMPAESTKVSNEVARYISLNIII